MDANLQEIETAITVGDKAGARQLLKPVLDNNPTADVWLLAAKASENDQETMRYLEKALELDPQHAEARSLYTRLQEFITPAQEVPSGEIDPASDPVPQPVSVIEEASDTSEGVYEMLWDCRFCGTEKLLGKTHKFCPNCGSPQDPTWRYFPSDDDKVAVKDHVFVGKDIQCANCTNLNPGNADYCGRCGSPLEGAEGVKTLGSREKAAGQRFEGEDLKARINAQMDRNVGRIPTPAKKPQKKRRRFVLYGIGAALIAIVGFILYAIFATQTETVYVTGHRWVYQVEIERLNAVDERREGRCSSVAPADAYAERERREQVDTRRVQDGETCRNVQVDQGDGTFRQERRCEPNYREEAVMGDVCYYTVDRWQSERTVESTGLLSDAISPPQLDFGCTGNRVGCEREGGHDIDYILQFGSGDDSFECTVDEALWQETGIESVFTVEFGRVGGGPRCNTLERSN